jgi:pimeloyl-ACP methyl ester carboxylesterase
MCALLASLSVPPLASSTRANLIAPPSIARSELFVTSDSGVRIHVRELRPSTTSTHKLAVSGLPSLLIHGARVPGVASFDLPVPGGSLAADLAERGFVVYVMDVRGFGQSTRPADMADLPDGRSPLVRSNDAVRDVDAVVDLIRRRNAGALVSLFGWAVGGQWAGYYATLHGAKLQHVIILNALYGAETPQPLVGHGSDLEDAAHPGRLSRAVGAYRCNTAASLVSAWDRSIPTPDKNAWRDPAVVDAYVREALASDPESHSHTPPCFRSPNGPLEDSFYLATGRQLWDASFISVPTLVIASQRDFWSRPEDRDLLFARLVHARAKRLVVIPNATHFVHLDRGDRGRDRLLAEVTHFCTRGTPST